KDVFQDTRTVLEPAGALAVAGARRYVAQHGWSGKTLVAITSGANMNFDRLRFVAERSDVGEAREAVFALTIPEERGSFRRLCDTVGNGSVADFNYRTSDERFAHVFVGIKIQSMEETTRFAEKFSAGGFGVNDLNTKEMAKTDLRYMVGGKSPLSDHEHLF